MNYKDLYYDILGSECLCEKCGRGNAITYRQHTFYQNKDDNYVTLCPICKIENDEYWDEMWKDYYSGCM